MSGTLVEILGYVGLALEAFLVVLLLRGPFRQYKVLFVYLFTQVASAAIEILVRNHYGARSASFRWTYWLFEILIDLLLFVLVSTLIYRVIGDTPHKMLIAKALASIAVAVITLPWLIFYNRKLFANPWFDGVSQFLNFGAGLMAFGLWGAVITTRTKDLRLLMVAAGLGLYVTGTAVSFGLRTFTADQGVARDMANIFGQLAFLASTLVWCWAFWRTWPTNSSRPAPVTGSPPEAGVQTPPSVLHT